MKKLVTIVYLLACAIKIFGQELPPPPPPPPPPPGYKFEESKPKLDLEKTKPISKRLSDHIENDCIGTLTRLSGSNIQLQIPEGYIEKQSWKFYKSDYELIFFNELPKTMPLSFLTDSTRKVFSVQNDYFFELQFTINGHKAILQESISDAGPSFGILALDNNKSYLMGAFTYDIKNKEQVHEIMNMIKSVCINDQLPTEDPMAQAGFSIDTSFSHFGAMRTGNRTLIFSSKEGLKQGILYNGPKFQLMESEYKSKDSIRQMMNSCLDGLKMYKAEAELLLKKTYNKNNLEIQYEDYKYTLPSVGFVGYMTLVTVSSEIQNQTLFFVCSAPGKENNYQQIWISTIESVIFKNK